MKPYTKLLLFIMAAFLSFTTVQTVRADDATVSGMIIDAYRDSSVIVIKADDGEIFTIIGFPFHNLEIQLDDMMSGEGVTIDVGDCVTVEYAEKVLSSGDIVYKWDSLTMYCEECDDTVCIEDDDGMLRDPNKNRPNPPHGPKKHKPKPKPGKGNGKPPGQRI